MKNLTKQNVVYSKTNEVKSRDFIENKYCFHSNNLLLLIVGFILIMQCGFSQEYGTIQKGKFGLALSGIITANGYGTQYSPAISYKKNRSTYKLGAIVQKRKMNLSGAQFTYEYDLMQAEQQDIHKLELFCFVSGFYHANAILGKNALSIENRVSSDYTSNASQLRFKSIEAYVGFGLRIKLFTNMQWINCIGAGGYTSFNFPDHLYYSGRNFGLTLRTGITYAFRK